MTQEEIIEGNKLIAKFIDLTPHNMFPDELQAPFGFEWIATNVNIRAMYAKEDNEFTSFEDLFLFHSSWDWLIPAVSKITRNEEFIEQENREYILDIIGYGHIEDVFEAVIEFIKWYNGNIL